MWCRSPRSYVHSIWRATSRGFADPFFFYYRTIWIGHPIEVSPISFRELQADPVWAKKPAIRAHFQNSSGTEVSFEEYEALLRLLETKEFDTSRLPRLARGPTLAAEGLETERDVEEKLLEPLLERLGYSRSDWIRQLPLRMGRGERFYPDYAFGVTGGRTRGVCEDDRRGEAANRDRSAAPRSLPPSSILRGATPGRGLRALCHRRPVGLRASSRSLRPQ